MPYTDSLQPPLTDAERAIVKAYGGWTNFLICFGLKPWNEEDAEEGVAIARAFAKDEEDDE
ncbi:uncharacterized protein BDV17DRAFT_287827 [Aspergillus undulatus]|uniref:uncharacterized protein n=1 Tax=Aspergillus undulatus TaxID=1810928 RepID=UPI003CCD6911